MKEIQSFLNDLTVSFYKHAESDGQSKEAIDEMTNKAQYISAFFKFRPETSHNPDVIETLELLAAPCPVEKPNLQKPCNDILNLIFRVLPSEELFEIWTITQDINLCCYIAEITPIKSYLLFEKLCFFIDKPSIDSIFFRRFVKLLSCRIEDDVANEYILPFTLILHDQSPLRSTLAFMVLNTFTKLNSIVSQAIIASWICCNNRYPLLSNHCRILLKKSPKDTLNMLATLSFDLPIVFAILPPDVDGYQMLCSIVVHRIQSFMPEKLASFLCLCDTQARNIIHHEFTKKKIEISGIPSDLQLFDHAFTASRSRAAISRMMEGEMTVNLFAAILAFARKSPLENASFLPPETISKIVQALHEQQNTHLINIPASEYEPDAVKSISKMLDECKINEILKTRENIWL
ncbi:hypothetical protein TRFO_35935 [Tritrichomonas foetus]|uniref:Uncharacterized protein n=1 Tax=Tritrichomonas foetus TaxID=1144522 RepID=A0A1J4JJR5_9EUKA|nr:hypothetical protein TRFO_35935 [Tritrichomonas foetus]|eukprot:OHS97763.1 hypothetical protein TRFO_35935 [Tritrichomonas foetus]